MMEQVEDKVRDAFVSRAANKKGKKRKRWKEGRTDNFSWLKAECSRRKGIVQFRKEVALGSRIYKCKSKQQSNLAWRPWDSHYLNENGALHSLTGTKESAFNDTAGSPVIMPAPKNQRDGARVLLHFQRHTATQTALKRCNFNLEARIVRGNVDVGTRICHEKIRNCYSPSIEFVFRNR